MGELSEWLRLMLAEIERKRDEARRAAADEAQRGTHETPPPSAS